MKLNSQLHGSVVAIFFHYLLTFGLGHNHVLTGN
jgi:hypothetical protein